MSIFAKVTAEDDVKNAERMQALATYAEILLGEYDIEPLVAKADLDNGITKAKLDHFQILIESASAQKEFRKEKGTTFAIESKEDLDWYLGLRLQYHSELEGVKAQYAKLIQQISSKASSLDFLFEEQAKAFAADEYKRTGVKTMILPHGTVAIRTTKPSWSIEDEGKLQEWLGGLSTENKTAYEVYPKTWTRNLDSLKFNAEKQLGKENGLVVPGLKRDPGGDKVSLRFPKEAAE